MNKAWNQVYCKDTDTVYSFTTEPTPSVRLYTRRNKQGKRFRYSTKRTSISFPRKTNCLTPISGHLEQNYFVADSHASCAYVAPPPECDLYREMEDQILSFFHLFDDFTAKDVAQAIWTGNAIIGTDGSVLNNNATYGISILIYQETGKQPILAAMTGGKATTPLSQIHQHGLPPTRSSRPFYCNGHGLMTT
jgi:hypothetical protein